MHMYYDGTFSTCTFDDTILWQIDHKIIENLKIVQSREIRYIHATFLVYLHNFVTLESHFCGIRGKIFCRFTIFSNSCQFCDFSQNCALSQNSSSKCVGAYQLPGSIYKVQSYSAPLKPAKTLMPWH